MEAMTTFPIKEFSEMPSNEQIAKVLKNAGAQRMELSGAYLCDSGDCKHRYGKWEDTTVIVEGNSHENKFKAKSRLCRKCGSIDVKIQ